MTNTRRTAIDPRTLDRGADGPAMTGRARGGFPTPERRLKEQDIEQVDVIIVPADVREVYDPAIRECRPVVVTPAVTSRAMRVVRPVITLRDRGSIDDRHVAAADRWYRDWSLVAGGGRDCADGRAGRSHAPGGLAEAVVIAASELRAADRAVGTLGRWVLDRLVATDVSCTSMAAQRGIRVEAMSGICISVLDRLREHYERPKIPVDPRPTTMA